MSTFLALLILNFVAFETGHFLTKYQMEKEFEQSALQHQCGQYNPQTGNFEWKDK